MPERDRNRQDEEMQHYAELAQGYPPQSRERQLALTKLVGAIAGSGKLSRPRQGEFIAVYEEIYAEALSLLWLFVCENIDRYDSRRGSVMTWVNYLLDKRFIIEGIKTVVGKKGDRPLSTAEVELIPQPETHPSPSQVLQQYIEEDREGRFQRTHLKNRPDVNFQQLALARLAGIKWKTLSADLNVTVSTLSSFYQRSLKELSDPLQSLFIDE
ncbi:hypothetical protein [Laspinema olomoucense]|uniref:hypothetical protein n=1 Tax=Laspinema olomoucense TaxID=3231600 RepID=UPI0021BAD953|nr:hypothetical protein [Laspinema sp. D3a]MCT7991023.1 hypothetical protein [Laspinema sp. D3a]